MTDKLKIVFMGTPHFAALHLERLLENEDYDIKAVYTQPDKAKGRSKKLIPTPVKEVALKKGFPVIQVSNLKDAYEISVLKDFNADVFCIVAYGLILNKEVLAIPKYGAINIHASILPKYRGASPVQYTLLNGEDKGGVTSFLLDDGIDTGPVLMQREVSISIYDNYNSLLEKLSVAGRDCLVATLNKIQDSNLQFKGTLQKNLDLPYTKKIKKEMAYLDFSKSAYILHNKIRALSSWPVCCLDINIGGKYKTIKIYKTSFINKCDGCISRKPGEVGFNNKKELHIKTGKGCLLLKDVQVMGKKVISIDSFLNGYKVDVGTFVISQKDEA